MGKTAVNFLALFNIVIIKLSSLLHISHNLILIMHRWVMYDFRVTRVNMLEFQFSYYI
jgi:hypothetical protein